MLASFSIGNFKAFSDVQSIPLRPLTLVFGANSSGKSSILHGLLFSRHALDTGDLDIRRTVIGGEAVDLGGFRQFIHRRHVYRRLEWRFELASSIFQGRLAELLSSAGNVVVSLTIALALDDKGNPLLGAVPEVQAFDLLVDGTSLLRMSRRRDLLQVDRLDADHPVFRKVLMAIVQASTTADSISPADFDGIEPVISEIVPQLQATLGKFFPEGLVRPDSLPSTTSIPLLPISRGRRQEDLAAAVRFFLPRTVDEIIRGVCQAVSNELMSLQYLGPLRSYPARHLAFSPDHDPNWLAGGGYAWDVVRRNKQVRDRVNNWLAAPDRLQTNYELVIRNLVAIEQLEAPILSSLETMNEEGLDLEPDGPDEDGLGGVIPVIKDPEKEAKRTTEVIRSWDLEKLDELVMIDRSTNTVVSHRDVGVGVSQVLPVLVSAFGGKQKIIAIEQPEIHLHPALQADLGDVFLESVLGPNQNRFLLETHSEHLMLRILRRIRETTEKTLPPGFPPVTPDKVMVLYVEPSPQGSKVIELPISEDGEFTKPWPRGFFAERVRELM